MMLEYPDLFNGYISDVPDFSLVLEKVHSKKAFDNIQDKKLNYYLFGNSFVKTLNEEFLSNYMHALELFFTDESTTRRNLVRNSLLRKN